MQPMAYLPALLLALAPIATTSAAWGQGGSGCTNITVDTTQRYQSFDGMGFSEAFQRGTQIYGAGGLSPANTSRVLELLFSDETGVGFTILRNGIGSSTTNPYDLMKSIETVSPGSPNNTPAYDWQGTTKPGFGLDNGQLRLTKDALARGVQKIYADAWSAPGFMKNNSNDSYGGYLCGVIGIECPTGDWRQAYANYLVQYLKFYVQSGISIDYVGFLNEPDLNVSYASMLSDGQQAGDFLKVLYPILQASGLKTEIACCDGSGWEQQRERLEGIEAAGVEYTLGLVTAHGYSSPLSTPFYTTRKVWETEWADLTSTPTLKWHVNGSAGEGLTWANNIQQLLAVSNVSAALYWIGADNTTSNSALILIDGDTVNVSKRLWAFAQYSRFVKPGARRIGVEASGAQFNMTAFENQGGSVALQVINNGNSTQEISVRGLTGQGHSSLAGWLTNEENDLTRTSVQADAGGIRATVPALSMLSIVSS
jgi:O-glycosyl hydrolase